jgi:hypothetical protein
VKDMTFEDREIVPIGGTKFGMYVTQKEAEVLARHDFNIRTLPAAEEEAPQHYLVVWVDERYMKGEFNLSKLEMAGTADLVIRPFPWKAGGRTGIKSYVISGVAKS